MSKSVCPIWGTPAETFPTRRDGFDVDSPRAGGRYFLSGTAQVNSKRYDDLQRARLTTWLIDQRRLGVECPEVMSNTLDDIDRHRSLTVHERADRLLFFMRQQTPSIGKYFSFAQAYLNAEAKSWEEHGTFSQMKAWSESLENEDVSYLIRFLEQRQFIEAQLILRNSVHEGPYKGKRDYSEYVIMPEGYAHLADLEKIAVNSQQAFVAMWFDESMRGIYESCIAQGIRDAGYEPVRIDGKDHNNKIDDEIIAEIRRSRFIVADFTHGEKGVRGGVYYEAGFARGLGLEVISTCREDMLKNNEIHFDTRQYNHIGWTSDKLNEFRKALANRISATIGDGPLKQ